MGPKSNANILISDKMENIASRKQSDLGAETGVTRLQVKGAPGMDSHPSLEARKEGGRVVLRVIGRNQRCQHLDLNCQLPEGQRCIPVVLTPTPNVPDSSPQKTRHKPTPSGNCVSPS